MNEEAKPAFQEKWDARRAEADRWCTQVRAAVEAYVTGEPYAVHEWREGVTWGVMPPTREHAIEEAALSGEGHEALPLDESRRLSNAFSHGLHH